MDVKCFVYKNKEYGQVVFTCPNVSQIDMSLIDLEPQR
jgi:hypothetical protein